MPLRGRDSTPSMHRATTRCSTASGTTRGRPGRGCQRRLPGCWRSTKRWSARTARRASSPGGSTPAWRSATRCWSGRSESSTPGSRSSSSGGGTRAGTARQSAPWGTGNELLANDRYADAPRGARRPGDYRARGRAHRTRRRPRPPAGEGRGGVRDRGRPCPGDRPAPLLPAGAQESLRPDVGRAIPNPGRRGESVREGRTLNAREDERPGSTAGQDEDAA